MNLNEYDWQEKKKGRKKKGKKKRKRRGKKKEDRTRIKRGNSLRKDYTTTLKRRTGLVKSL